MSFVYFIKPIGIPGPIKIGLSINPTKRLIALTYWSPLPLEIIGTVPGTYKDESFMHACFSDIHSHREWFHATPALLDAINISVSAGSFDLIRETLKPKGGIRPRIKRPRPPDQRLFISYCHRIWSVERRRQKQGIAAYRAPDDVGLIVARGYRKYNLTPSEVARFDEVLSDPDKYFVAPSWKPLRLVS